MPNGNTYTAAVRMPGACVGTGKFNHAKIIKYIGRAITIWINDLNNCICRHDDRQQTHHRKNRGQKNRSYILAHVPPPRTRHYSRAPGMTEVKISAITRLKAPYD